MVKYFIAFLLFFLLGPFAQAKTSFEVVGFSDKIPVSIKENFVMKTGIFTRITGELGTVDLNQVHLIFKQKEPSSLENINLTLRYFSDEGCSYPAFSEFVINEISDSNYNSLGFQVVGTLKQIDSNHSFEFGNNFRLTFEKKVNSKIVYTFEINEDKLDLTVDFKKSTVLNVNPIIDDTNDVIFDPTDSSNVALIKSNYESAKKDLENKYQTDSTNLTSWGRTTGDQIGVDCIKAKDDNLVRYNKAQDDAKLVYYSSKIGVSSSQSYTLLQEYRAALDRAKEFYNSEKNRLDAECKTKKDNFALEYQNAKIKLYDDYQAVKTALKKQYDLDIYNATLANQGR